MSDTNESMIEKLHEIQPTKKKKARESLRNLLPNWNEGQIYTLYTLIRDDVIAPDNSVPKPIVEEQKLRLHNIFYGGEGDVT